MVFVCTDQHEVNGFAGERGTINCRPSSDCRVFFSSCNAKRQNNRVVQWVWHLAHLPDDLVTLRSKICLNHASRGLVSQSVNGGTNDPRETIAQSGDGLYE